MNTYKITAKSTKDTEKLGIAIAKSLTQGLLICMYGDIGAGKTTLTKTIGQCLNIKEKITSPSFVILNEYHSGRLDMYHFDLYRLENAGLETILDELNTYATDKNALTIVEWAEFSKKELEIDRLSLQINYINDSERLFEFKAFGEIPQKTLKKIKRNFDENFDN